MMKVRLGQALIAGVAVAVTLLPTVGSAAGKMSSHSKMHSHMAHTTKAASVTCPVCKMPMKSTKSKAAPLRVAVNHHYYYCCTACGFKGDKASSHSKMSSHKSKMGGHKSKMGGHMSKMGGHMSKMGGHMSKMGKM